MSLNTEICNAFNAQAFQYEQTAKVQLEVGDRLFERLYLLKIRPKYILDLGCGPGMFIPRLEKLYPDAVVIGLDLALEMLKQAKVKSKHLVQADMLRMPFPTGLFDLVFANQVIHWSISLPDILMELNRIIKPAGCLMFSTLGPDTFCELRQAWTHADQYLHTNDFIDMHDVGDALLQGTFLEPVVDMEMLYAHYKTLPLLLNSLRAQGVRNINPQRRVGLTGKKVWRDFEEAMCGHKTPAGYFPLTYEVIYGHAWKGMQRAVASGTEVRFPIDNIRGKHEGIY